MAKILFATTAEGVKFYPVTITDAVVHIKGNTQTKLSELLDNIDYTGKADKVTGAVSGNFAGLDSNGNLTDSGSKASDFKTVQTAVTDPSAGSATDAYQFIATIAQNANGVIAATKQAVRSASAIQSGLMSADDFSKLAALPTRAELTTEENAKADKVTSATSGNFAGLDSNGNLTDSGSKASDFEAAGTAQNLIDALDATPSQTAGADGLALSLTQVDGKVTAISGSIAANTYDAYGSAAAVLGASGDAATATTVYGAKAYSDANKSTVIGAPTDAKTADTINGAKAYADDAVATAMTSIAGALVHKGVVNSNSDLPASANVETGWQYTVATAGTYDGVAMEVGDYLIWNGTGWDKVNGENQVTNEAADLVIGTATKIATVDGTDITVKQVEDMTKIEAVAVADTTDYDDVTALFTAPAQG